MQTVFDQVISDYLIISMIANTLTLGTVAIGNIFDDLNETFARVLSLTIFYFNLADMIHMSSACLTRLASICLIGTIEEVNGKSISALIY
jgi:hypothetical protein